MTDKVYIVEAYKGEFEDRVSWVHSVWLDEVDANNAKTKLEEDVAKLKLIPKPFGDKDVMDLTDEEYDVHEKWQTDNNNATDFNSAKIIEYKIGEIKSLGLQKEE